MGWEDKGNWHHLDTTQGDNGPFLGCLGCPGSLACECSGPCALMNPCPLDEQLDRAGRGWSQAEPVPSTALASGCGGGRLDSVTELGSEVTEVGGSWLERQRETESPHQVEKGQSRGRNGAETQEEAWYTRVQAPERGPSLPPATHGLWGWGSWGPRWWWQLQQAGAGWVGAQGTRQADKRRVARMTGPPSPALSPWGRGVCGGPPQTGPGPRRCCGLPACHLSEPLFSLLFSVSLHLCVHLSVYILPCHSIVLCHSLPFCNSVCLSLFSFCLCFSLPVPGSSLIVHHSLCLSVSPSPHLSLPLPVSKPLFFHLISLSLSVSPSVPAPPSPQPQPRWAPGLLWAPPFSIPRRGGNWGVTEVGLLPGEGAGQEGGGGRLGPVGIMAQEREIRAPLPTLLSAPCPDLPVCQGPYGPLNSVMTLTCCVTWV